jgi:hypothetical protein
MRRQGSNKASAALQARGAKNISRDWGVPAKHVGFLTNRLVSFPNLTLSLLFPTRFFNAPFSST